MLNEKTSVEELQEIVTRLNDASAACQRASQVLEQAVVMYITASTAALENLGRAKDAEYALENANEAIRHLAKGVDFERLMPNETRPTIRKALAKD